MLSEFRTRLVNGKLELVLLEALLESVQKLELLKQRGKQRIDSCTRSKSRQPAESAS
jgi:transposase